MTNRVPAYLVTKTYKMSGGTKEILSTYLDRQRAEARALHFSTINTQAIYDVEEITIGEQEAASLRDAALHRQVGYLATTVDALDPFTRHLEEVEPLSHDNSDS